MTKEEFDKLKVGDIVYYYNSVNINKISHISASLKKKKVKIIFEKDDVTNRRVGFEQGGVILMSILHMFDTDRDKLLYTKLVEIKEKMAKEVLKSSNRIAITIQQKYDRLWEQKNIQHLLKKYPELFI